MNYIFMNFTRTYFHNIQINVLNLSSNYPSDVSMPSMKMRLNMICGIFSREKMVEGIKRLLCEWQNSASMVTFSRLPRAQAIGLSAINFYFSLSPSACWLFFSLWNFHWMRDLRAIFALLFFTINVIYCLHTDRPLRV